MEGLRDIKGFVDIPDNSLYIFIAILLILLLVIGLIIYHLRKPKRRKREKLTKKQLAFKNLLDINFDDTKDAVYTFSTSIQILDQKNLAKKLLEELKLYKYKKDTPPLKDEHIIAMKKIIEEIKDAKH